MTMYRTYFCHTAHPLDWETAHILHPPSTNLLVIQMDQSQFIIFLCFLLFQIPLHTQNLRTKKHHTMCFPLRRRNTKSNHCNEDVPSCACRCLMCRSIRLSSLDRIMYKTTAGTKFATLNNNYETRQSKNPNCTVSAWQKIFILDIR